MLDSGINVTTTFPAIGSIASISVWRVGDFFLLQDLCKLALDGFKEQLRKASWEFSGMSRPEHLDESIKNCVDFVRQLYQQGRSSIFEAFAPTTLSFLASVIHIFGESREFRNLLRDIPKFSTDWAVALTDSMASIKTPPHTSNKCAKCRKLGVTHLNRARWVKEQKVEHLCKKCFPFQRLRNWDGEGIGMAREVTTPAVVATNLEVDQKTTGSRPLSSRQIFQIFCRSGMSS
jgi:hypothetical protein